MTLEVVAWVGGIGVGLALLTRRVLVRLRRLAAQIAVLTLAVRDISDGVERLEARVMKKRDPR